MNIDVTQDDIDAARLTGATGAQLIERSIHSALDRAGVPCAGRAVTVTMDTITIDLPPGSPIRHSRGGVVPDEARSRQEVSGSTPAVRGAIRSCR